MDEVFQTKTPLILNSLLRPPSTDVTKSWRIACQAGAPLSRPLEQGELAAPISDSIVMSFRVMPSECGPQDVWVFFRALSAWHACLPLSNGVMLASLLRPCWWIYSGDGRKRGRDLSDNVKTPFACTAILGSGPRSGLLRQFSGISGLIPLVAAVYITPPLVSRPRQNLRGGLAIVPDEFSSAKSGRRDLKDPSLWVAEAQAENASAGEKKWTHGNSTRIWRKGVQERRLVCLRCARLRPRERGP
ncbi:hypothetical protein OF83DRAFT_622721 [Amylostereum chailletii]|nr:hypothetical protein OF83DRAFT_622721 [Amylostereum chailletii]